MSELIRREDALRCLSSRAGRDLPTTALMLGISMEIAALPAIGTCKDCAEWDTANRATSKGGCCNRTRAYEPCDHYCAAFKRGPDNA